MKKFTLYDTGAVRRAPIRITRGPSMRGCSWSFITEMKRYGAERFPSVMVPRRPDVCLF